MFSLDPLKNVRKVLLANSSFIFLEILLEVVDRCIVPT